MDFSPIMSDHPQAPSDLANRTGMSVNIFDSGGEIRPLEEIETDVIKVALLMNQGCVTRAALQLRIGRSTLYRRLVGTTLSERAAMHPVPAN